MKSVLRQIAHTIKRQMVLIFYFNFKALLQKDWKKNNTVPWTISTFAFWDNAS